MDSQEDLCPDMILEVLSRTTLSTLDTCKCVCKEWRNNIHHPNFMRTYCNRTNTFFGFFVQDYHNCRCISDFVSMDKSARVGDLPHDMEILASSTQGVLCCMRRIGQNYHYYAGKPTTKQWQPLPNPKLRFETVSVILRVLGINPLHYKIIRLSLRWFFFYGRKYQCEVFDSKAWTWKETQSIVLPASEFIRYTTPGVHIGSCFHWLTHNDNIVMYDETKESFHVFPLPEAVYNNCIGRNKILLNYQGKLGLTHLTKEEELELWLRQDLVGVEWEKAISTTTLVERFTFVSLAGFYTNTIAVFKEYSEIIFYNVKDNSFGTVELDYRLSSALDVFLYRSDSKCVSLRTNS